MAERKLKIYVVTHRTGENTTDVRLIRAPSPAHAENHVASATITAVLATQDELVDLASKGCKVEDAKLDTRTGNLPLDDPK